MAESKKKKKVLYKVAEANKLGLGATPTRHGASRNPYTGLMFKLPGHKSLNKSLAEDRSMGYRIRQIGKGLSSYSKRDPRGQMGSISAPRDTDISGALFDSEIQKAIREGKAPRTAKRYKGR